MSGLNLIPAGVLAARARRRHLQAWSTAIGTALCALALPLIMDWTNRARAGEMETVSENLISELQQLRTQHREATTQATLLQGQIERAKALRSKRAWSAMLGLVGSCLPDSAWLTLIATDPPTPAAGGLPGRTLGRGKAESESADKQTVTIDAPRRLKVRGYTENHEEIYEFMRLLKGAGVFSEVTLIRSGIEHPGKQPAVGFEVICEW